MQFLDVNHGWMQVMKCGHPACEGFVAFTQVQYERYTATGATFYCVNGHPRVFRGQVDPTRRLEAQLAQEKRLREEAERRAADVERERERLNREVVVEKRTTRRALKVAAHVVEEHESQTKKKQPRSRSRET